MLRCRRPRGAGGGRAAAGLLLLPLLLLLLLLLGAWPEGAAAGGTAMLVDGAPRCHHSQAYGLMAADCHGVQLREVPQNLHRDIQALVLTFNRIREVRAGDFDRYPSLELLYLDDNAVSLLEEGALEGLSSLRVLTLSLNSLVSVPATLLRAPSLTRLSLAQNPLAPESLAAALAAAPAESELQALSLADCRLRSLPPLHRLRRLRDLNVTGNPLEALSAAQLAPLCSLRKATLGEAHAAMAFCDCELLRQWAERDQLLVTPPEALECAGRPGEAEGPCANSSAAREAAALRAECRRALEAQDGERQRRRVWAWAGGGVGALAALLALVALCCWCRRRGRKRKSAAEVGARPPFEIRHKFDEEEEPMKK